jgi:hypothetical protein
MKNKIQIGLPLIPLIFGIFAWTQYHTFNLDTPYSIIMVHFVLIALIIAPIALIIRGYNKRNKKW